MRFITRSLMGLMLLTLTLALLALAGSRIFLAYKDKSAGGFGNREVRERVFTVEVMVVKLGAEFPEIQTFGSVLTETSRETRSAHQRSAKMHQSAISDARSLRFHLNRLHAIVLMQKF